MDDAIGKLRRELRQLGIARNTLFWYTSDNGALKVGSAGGLSGHKGNLLEGGIRVPCIIEWPARISRPRVSTVPCGTVDIYPTLLEIAGAKVANQPKPLDGVSLVPLIAGQMSERSKPLGFWTHPTRGIPTRSTQLLQQLAKEQAGLASPSPPEADPAAITKIYPIDSFPGNAAWISGTFKLHRRVPKQGEVTYSLFDLENDPQEKVDLASQQPKRVEQLRAELAAWQKSVVNSLNGQDYK